MPRPRGIRSAPDTSVAQEAQLLRPLRCKDQDSFSAKSLAYDKLQTTPCIGYRANLNVYETDGKHQFAEADFPLKHDSGGKRFQKTCEVRRRAQKQNVA